MGMRGVHDAIHDSSNSATHDNKEFRFSDGRAEQFCMLFIVPIMIGLKMHEAQRYLDFVHGKEYTPLLEIAQNFSFRGFEELLSQSKTYDERDSQKTLVKLEDKLKNVYDALFVTVYNDTVYRMGAINGVSDAVITMASDCVFEVLRSRITVCYLRIYRGIW